MNDPTCAKYKGTKSTTSSGKKCQAWNQQSPHLPSVTKSSFDDAGDFETNYCRNPDGEPGAWCYTMDPKKRWEDCGIPTCPAKDVDDCQPNPCVYGTCTDGVNSHTRQCTPGYTGDNCDEDVDDCQPNPCVHGTCTDGVNSHTCQCTPGYTGDNCDEDVDDCQPNPCVHGTCTDGVNSHTCQCTPGYTGDNCDEEFILASLSGGTPGASSIHASDFSALNAFKSSGEPWANRGSAKFPHTVWYNFPKAIKVAKFQFSSRVDCCVHQSITEFQLVGSNDCTSWTVIQSYNTQFNSLGQKKSWTIPDALRKSFNCYGVRVTKVASGSWAAINNLEFYTASSQTTSQTTIKPTANIKITTT